MKFELPRIKFPEEDLIPSMPRKVAKYINLRGFDELYKSSYLPKTYNSQCHTICKSISKASV